MTECGEYEAPSPTSNLASSKCCWHYGSHRCELRAGHDALGIQHQITMRFDVEAKPVAEGEPPALNDKPCVHCRWCSELYCTAWMRSVHGGVIPACRTWTKRDEVKP